MYQFTHPSISPPPPHSHRKFAYDFARIVGSNKLTISFIEIKILVVKILGNPYNKEEFQVQFQVIFITYLVIFSYNISVWLDEGLHFWLMDNYGSYFMNTD